MNDCWQGPVFAAAACGALAIDTTDKLETIKTKDKN
jgi:hypothetical protein